MPDQGKLGSHRYLSTACIHNLHEEKCRKTCKYCGNHCVCNCHDESLDDVRQRARAALVERVRDAGIVGIPDGPSF